MCRARSHSSSISRASNKLNTIPVIAVRIKGAAAIGTMARWALRAFLNKDEMGEDLPSIAEALKVV
jgi:hypothetical protein